MNFGLTVIKVTFIITLVPDCATDVFQTQRTQSKPHETFRRNKDHEAKRKSYLAWWKCGTTLSHGNISILGKASNNPPSSFCQTKRQTPTSKNSFEWEELWATEAWGQLLLVQRWNGGLSISPLITLVISRLAWKLGEQEIKTVSKDMAKIAWITIDLEIQEVQNLYH